MNFRPAVPENKSQPGQKPRPGLWLAAAAVSVSILFAGTLILNLQSSEIEARAKVELLVQASAMRARLSREINKVLYLTSGLSSYLAVRHGDLNRTEVEAILEGLYRDSPHVRNFGIAVGYRVTYVYPVKGNEKAVGLYYPDLKTQWPAIQKTVETGRPSLAGPLQLVQGGRGFIYRIPIIINDRYWGLLSSVIDSESLLSSALDDSTTSGLAVAIRSKDSSGVRGDVFWGETTLFGDPAAQLVEVDVPGGQWVMALRSTMPSPWQRTLSMMHGLVWLLALILGWVTWFLLKQRTELSQLALFDALTGLPNRVLIDDRVSQAMSALRRDPSRMCMLLFVDLDHFKKINDRLGHRAGDFTLQSTARRISGVIRETDTVGRWGGDEFIVFMENVDATKISDIIDKIRRTVEAPILFGAEKMRVGASIGSACAPADGLTLDELIRAADSRMYSDKAGRRNTAPA